MKMAYDTVSCYKEVTATIGHKRVHSPLKIRLKRHKPKGTCQAMFVMMSQWDVISLTFTVLSCL